MFLVLYVIVIGLGGFFIWFAYDFYDDYMSGIYKNQGSVEFMKETYGIQVIFIILNLKQFIDRIPVFLETSCEHLLWKDLARACASMELEKYSQLLGDDLQNERIELQKSE